MSQLRVHFAIALALLSVSACMDFGDLSGNDGADFDDGGSPSNADASTQDSQTPNDAGCGSFEDVCNGDRAIDVAGGQSFGCALLATGKVWCWGSNRSGQTGQPPVDSLVPPTEVPNLSNIVQIRAGSSFACALDDAGAVWCWGDNRFGQLGHPQSADLLCPSCINPTPTKVSNVGFVKTLEANYAHACAAISTGDIYCWGDDELGQLGYLTDGGPSFTPSRVPFSGVAVSAGASESCALTAAAQVVCWGSNLNEQLGHPENTGQDFDSGFGYTIDPRGDFAANDAGPLAGFSQISTGALHTCALADGSVTCWGSFSGPNQVVVESLPPHDVGLTGVTQVTTGAFHTCILQGPSGDVQCWGNNWDYAVGIGPQDSGYGGAQNPTPLGIQAKVIRGGYGQTLAIAADGSVWQWGGGGAFADASTQPVPRKIEGLP